MSVWHLSIKQHRSIDFPEDPLKCIKHFFRSLLQCPHLFSYHKTDLVRVSYGFIFVCLCTSLGFISGSSEWYAGPILFIFHFISVFGDACSWVDKVVYYFRRVSPIFTLFPICVLHLDCTIIFYLH